MDGKVRSQFSSGVIVRSIGKGKKLNLFSCYQFFYYMAASKLEGARVIHIRRVIVP